MLIIFGGLPASGKTTIARELAVQIAAVYLRVDSIEHALRDSGAATDPLNEAGYCVGYALAEDNLRLGNIVVADSVNPLDITRDAWTSVADRAGVRFLEVEVVCSDQREHRRRLKTRQGDIAGLRLPSWEDVVSREYHSWQREHVVADTSRNSVEEIVNRLRTMLPKPASLRSL